LSIHARDGLWSNCRKTCHTASRTLQSSPSTVEWSVVVSCQTLVSGQSVSRGWPVGTDCTRWSTSTGH